LREAGLVKMEKHAQQHLYQINPEAMLELADWSKQLTQLWNKRLDALEAVLKVEIEKINKEKRKLKMVKELTIKHVFDAPRELVFKAWTDPKLIIQWWGPDLFTTPTAEVDGRLGGKLYIVMHGPKGSDFDVDMPIRGVFTEYDPPRRLVFTNQALFDEHGNPQLDTLCTVTFTELGSKTEMTLHLALEKSNPAAEGAWAGAEIGWNQSLDKLAGYLVRVMAEA
jgi:uncharacterized protein YndB with AHSA1/START domain